MDVQFFSLFNSQQWQMLEPLQNTVIKKKTLSISCLRNREVTQTHLWPIDSEYQEVPFENTVFWSGPKLEKKPRCKYIVEILFKLLICLGILSVHVPRLKCTHTVTNLQSTLHWSNIKQYWLFKYFSCLQTAIYFWV